MRAPNSPPRFARSAFTLVEILVVIGIIALLAAVLAPALSVGREKALSAACLGNLRALGVALHSYLGEHEMRMPDAEAARPDKNFPADAIDVVLAPYVDDARAFACPADHSLAVSTGTSYYYNSALRGQPATELNFLGVVDAKSRIPVLVDKEGWHQDGASRVNHLFADGSAGAELRLFAQ